MSIAAEALMLWFFLSFGFPYYALSQSSIFRHDQEMKSANNRNLCLASSQNHPRINGYHYFPMDIFDPPLYKEYVASSHGRLNDSFYQCVRSPNAKEILHCPSSHKFCPINHQNVLDVVNATESWMYPTADSPPYLMRIWEKLGNHQATINLIVFGGSATIAADSTGCQCNPDLDSKCSRNRAFMEAHADGIFEKRCRWANLYARWLRSISYATINFEFLALSGTSSKYLSQTIESIMNGRSFSENDLVLIDYSMNDALSYSYDHKVQSMEVGIERLVRRIYELSPDSFPTLILLETWPWNRNVLVNPATTSGIVDYSKIYRKYAKHYGIPIWSYRDFLWSEYAVSKQSMFINELRFPDHPMWIPHMHMADLLAAVTWRELLRCALFVSPKITSSKDLPLKRDIPPPISHFDDSSFCASDVEPLLDLDANDLYRHGIREHPLVHTLPIGSKNSWRLIEDRPGKAGWIDEFSAEDQQSKPVKGIVFEIPYNRSKEVLENSRDVIVQLKYMRTYLNAGAMSIFTCNERKIVESVPANDAGVDGNLDGYWPTKVSIIEVYTFPIKIAHWPALCAASMASGDDVMRKLKINSTYVMLTHSLLSLQDPEIRAVRTDRQKVKVTGIKICTAPPRNRKLLRHQI